MSRASSVQVNCPANTWTKVAEGSFWNLALTYDLTAGVNFDWHWIGTGLPWFLFGSGGPGGVTSITVAPATYWRIEVNPHVATRISIMTPG